MRQFSLHWLQTPKAHMALAVILLAAIWVGAAPSAMAQTSATTGAPTETAEDDGRLSYEEILAMFQREARAAYQMNREACAGLEADAQKKCLAAARLQFDQDLRYAQRRADQGY